MFICSLFTCCYTQDQALSDDPPSESKASGLNYAIAPSVNSASPMPVSTLVPAASHKVAQVAGRFLGAPLPAGRAHSY